MNNYKSEKSHWECVMSVDINSIKKAINWFRSTEYFKLFSKYIDKVSWKKTFFEIWASPWMYWAIFHKYFWYFPSGIEYTDNWYKSIEVLYNDLGIKHEHIKWDFFTFNSDKKYDLVFSWGFIEHFEDYENVILRHIELAKKSWLVVIIVPNFHFYFRKFQEFIYPWLISKQHKIEIMNAGNFNRVINKLSDEWIIKIKYLGWFWKAKFGQLVGRNRFFQKMIYAIDLICDKFWLYNILPKEYSSLICIVEKL